MVSLICLDWSPGNVAALAGEMAHWSAKTSRDYEVIVCGDPGRLGAVRSLSQANSRIRPIALDPRQAGRLAELQTALTRLRGTTTLLFSCASQVPEADIVWLLEKFEGEKPPDVVLASRVDSAVNVQRYSNLVTRQLLPEYPGTDLACGIVAFASRLTAGLTLGNEDEFFFPAIIASRVAPEKVEEVLVHYSPRELAGPMELIADALGDTGRLLSFRRRLRSNTYALKTQSQS